MTSKSFGSVDERPHVARLLKLASGRKGYENELCGLGFQNFQSIREPAFVPVAPLTFLYGPNSAGKSSVGDAIQFLHRWGSPGTSFDVDAELVRWASWDRHSALRQERSFVGTPPSVRLWAVLSEGASGVGRAHGRIDDKVFEDCFGPFDMLVGESPLAISVAFDTKGQGSSAEKRADFEWIEFGMWVGAETDDPLLRVVRETRSESDLTFVLVNTIHPGYARLSDGWHETRDGVLSGDTLSGLRDSEDGHWMRFYADKWGAHLRERPVSMLISESWQWSDKFAAQDAAAEFLRGFVQLSMAAVAGGCRVIDVPPVRRVPTASESTFHIEAILGGSKLNRAQPAGDPDDPWHRLAVAATYMSLNSEESNDEAELLRYVNRVLGSESMLGLEYRVDADLQSVSPRVHLGTRDGSVSGTKSIAGWQVHLYLRADDGQRVDFADVGSGVAQVVPVVVALHRRHAVIHQPELHLHPRLQSVLGDVLIDRPDRTVAIVESHSEHILIRVLRRLRDTAASAGRETAFAVHPDDITVLYFKPVENVGTRIFQLRLSAAGEFLDRWPDGFFSERDEDLGLSSV